MKNINVQIEKAEPTIVVRLPLSVARGLANPSAKFADCCAVEIETETAFRTLADALYAAGVRDIK